MVTLIKPIVLRQKIGLDEKYFIEIPQLYRWSKFDF
jgi:hypothetical protein